MEINLSLRQAIMQRVENKSDDELTDIIEGSIGQDEKALPGLGVLFEIIWEHCGPSTQKELVSILKAHI